MKQFSKVSLFLWKFCKPQSKMLLIPVVFALVLAISESLSPYIIKIIIDHVSITHVIKPIQWDTVFIYGMFYVALVEVVNLMFRWKEYFKLKIFPNIKADILLNIFSHLMGHSFRFFLNYSTGSLMNRMLDITRCVESIFNMLIEVFLWRALSLLIAAAAMCSVSPFFMFIVFIWANLFVYITVKMSASSRKASRHFASSRNKLIGLITDILSNIINVLLFQNAKKEKEILASKLREHTKKEKKMLKLIMRVGFIQGLLVTLFTACIITLLLYNISHGYITSGDFAFIIVLSGTLVRNVYSISSDLLQLFKEVEVCRQAISVLTKPHDVMESKNTATLQISKGTIKFENVYFKHDDQAYIFKKQNILIKECEHVGIVGLSGAGKSTFINLLIRIYDINKGRILIDNQDISKVSIKSLRDNIAIVPQDVALFNRSIFENIQYGHVDATYDEVISASKKANCHEFINCLPKGYKALVGEKGVKLSGGQKQRIALARAFLKEKPILVLDEPTSSVDSISESRLHQEMQEFFKNKTVFVISHSLSTLKMLDRILVFDDGVIVGDGTHEQLVMYCDIYRKICDLQKFS